MQVARSKTQKPGFELNPTRPTLVLFHMHGCPYCEALMPTWNTVKAVVQNHLTKPCDVIEIERFANLDTMSHHGIKTYPTIAKFMPNGERINFPGEDRTHANLIQFATAHSPITSSKGRLVLFHASWCGHCIKLRPTWNEAVAALKDIECVEHEATAEPEIMQQFGIQGFPTIMWVEGDRQIKFTGDRNVTAITNFARAGGRSE